MGNVVTDWLPAEVAATLKRDALLALGVVAFAILVVSLLRGFVLGSGSLRDPISAADCAGVCYRPSLESSNHESRVTRY